MKYVALLSGGKDSCYNLVHCALNGHELVAAASLRPESGKEELDSYLYQTVGQDAIEFVARALEVPLYRQVIQGSAVEQGSEYGGRNAKDSGGIAGDETEDLFNLLSTVKSSHPDIQGVSVGAILSNYQRVRVEHVCRRLGLTSLSYLWQSNQAELLDEMIEGGMEAILIKVAGIGLTKAHLGKTLAEMQPTLIKLNTLYGSHICGEGGEYESLTLDCPLFKHRIILTETETVIHSDNDFATVAFLRIKGARLEAKPSPPQLDISVPPLLDETYDAIREAVLQSQNTGPLASSSDSSTLKFRHSDAPLSRSSRNGAWVTVSNVQISPSTAQDLTLDAEVTQCFDILSDRLAEHELDLSDCAIINISISSMDLFLRVNAIYSTFFGVSPAARACVAVDLPEGIRVRLESVACRETNPGDRQALHVQGLSYWAPANIGPYSQAIVAGEHVFISGQIGLIPSQLAMPSPPSLATEMALSSQHVARVTSALKENSGGGWAGHNQLSIYWLAHIHDLPHVKKGHLALKAPKSPTIFLVVKELPKGALVEKQVLVHTGRVQSTDEEGELVSQSCTPSFEQGQEGVDSFHWEVSNLAEGVASCTLIFAKGDIPELSSRFKTVLSDLSKTLCSAISVRYFYCPAWEDQYHVFTSTIFEGNVPPVTTIPCRSIASKDKDDWDIAICVISC